MFYRELEATINGLPAPPGPLALGHATHLSQEVTHERQALYVELINSHKWIDKVSAISKTFGDSEIKGEFIMFWLYSIYSTGTRIRPLG